MSGLKDTVTKTVISGGVAIAQAAGGVALSAEVMIQISKAKTDAASIATASKKIPGAVGVTVANVAIEAQGIIEQVEQDPRDFSLIRSFFDYNLTKASEVVSGYVHLFEIDTDSANLVKVEGVIKEILDNFKAFSAKCRSNDITGAHIAAESLSRIIRANI